MFPGKATRVTSVEKEDLKTLLPPLSALQALAAELAIPHLTSELIDTLTDTNHRFATAIKTKDNFSALKIDQEFHQYIVDAAGNSYVDDILGRLQAHVRRQFFHHSLILTLQSVEEHAKIIAALKERDTEKICNLMKANWNHTAEDLSL